MKEDIIRILVEYRDTMHNGNVDQTAKALGVHTPTLWRWLKGQNVPKVESISQAFDTLNAKIILPGEIPPAPPHELTQKIESLRKEVETLTKENNTLLRKLVIKYEADDRLKKEDPENQETYAQRPASAIISRMDSTAGTEEPL